MLFFHCLRWWRWLMSDEARNASLQCRETGYCCSLLFHYPLLYIRTDLIYISLLSIVLLCSLMFQRYLDWPCDLSWYGHSKVEAWKLLEASMGRCWTLPKSRACCTEYSSASMFLRFNNVYFGYGYPYFSCLFRCFSLMVRRHVPRARMRMHVLLRTPFDIGCM